MEHYENIEINYEYIQPEKTYSKSELFLSWVSAYANLTNTTIGAGTLSIPFVMYESGIALGSILLFLTMLLAIYVFILLIETSHDTKSKTNKELCVNTISNKFSYFFEFMVFTFCVGVCCVYMNLLGQSFSKLLISLWGKHLIFSPYFLAGMLMIFIVGPLSFLRNISFLSYTSTMSVCAMIFVGIVVVIKFCEGYNNGTVHMQSIRLFRFDNILGILFAFPAILFAFTSHFNLVPVYREMKNKSKINMSSVVICSMFTCFLVYFTIGIFGYMTFAHTSKMLGNVLENYQKNSVIIIIAKMMVYVVILLSYPVVNFAGREAFYNVFIKDSINDESYFKWTVISLTLFVVTYVVGLFVPDILILINLSVTLSGAIGCLLIPILMYFAYYKNILKRTVSLIVGVLLSIACITCSGLAVYELILYFMKN